MLVLRAHASMLIGLALLTLSWASPFPQDTSETPTGRF